MGHFLVQNRSLFWLLPSCAGHWDRLRLPKQNKKGRTQYIFLIKILLMDWQLYLTPWNFSLWYFSIDLWLRLFSTFLLLSLYCILPGISTSSFSGTSLSHRGRRETRWRATRDHGKEKEESRLLPTFLTSPVTRQVFPRTVLGDFGHLLYFFSA